MASKTPAQTFFNVAGVPQRGITAVSNITTDWLDMTDYDAGWLVYVDRSLTTGNPRWTIEHSYDATADFIYKPETENLTIPEDVRESRFKPNYMRIVYTASGATGTVTFVLIRTNSI